MSDKVSDENERTAILQIAKMTEAIQAQLDGLALEQFDKMIGLVNTLGLGLEDADGEIDPPAMLGLEDDALRAFLAWLQAMTTLVTVSLGRAPADSTPLTIVAALCVGKNLEARLL